MKTKQRNFKKKKPSLLASHLANKYFKGIRKNLEKARSADTADSYINKGLNFSLMVSIVLSFVFFFIIRQTGRGIGWAVGFFIIAYIALFIYFINIPSVMIMRLQRDVDKQLLFAARHMLISIDAGQTLISAMGKIAKHDYGKASDMFSEVIKDIELGKSLEESIEHAIERSPSEILTKLFIEIDNSLKIGTDISINRNCNDRHIRKPI